MIQHLCGLAEEGIGKDVIKRPEIRVIENVEEFASGLKPQTLGERELPSQSEIHLGYTESTQCVPAQVSLLTGGWCLEASWVQTNASRNSWITQIERHSRDNIGTQCAGYPQERSCR